MSFNYCNSFGNIKKKITVKITITFIYREPSWVQHWQVTGSNLDEQLNGKRRYHVLASLY